VLARSRRARRAGEGAAQRACLCGNHSASTDFADRELRRNPQGVLDRYGELIESRHRAARQCAVFDEHLNGSNGTRPVSRTSLSVRPPLGPHAERPIVIDPRIALDVR